MTPETERMKVLVADDDAATRLQLCAMLGAWGHDVQAVTDGTEAWKILGAGERPSIAILDRMLAGLDGIEVCRRVRQQGDWPCIYIVMTSLRADRNDVFAGLDAGADDWLAKPVDAVELEARLRVARRVMHLQQRLRVEAALDPLTGIWSRRGIEEVLGREFARSLREGRPLAALMIDLDRFQAVNDAHGRVVGDEMLRELVRRMQAGLRGTDAIGRYGGEEFLVVLSGANAILCGEIAERLRLRIARQPLATRIGEVAVTASIGAAATHIPSGTLAERLIQRAGDALLEAKRAGRNRVTIAADDSV
ncbi:MAG: diguanylate cyclase [Gammaproteobacteria bacterium]